MPEFALALLFVAAMLAAVNWRMGLTLCVLTAVLQDPLRKLTPNEPAYFILFAGVVFAAAALGALLTGKRLLPNAVKGWRSQMGKPFTLFLVLVVFQAVHSFVRFGSPQIPVIGLISYLAPVPAFVFSYHFALRKGLTGMRAWMWFYVLVAGVALSGVYLEYMGLSWKALGEVGAGIVLYDVGGILEVYSGFFRSSEVAAWHTTAISCFLFILLIGRRFTLPRLVMTVALVGLLVSLGMLTGRRKMLVAITVFVCAHFALVAWFQNRSTRPAVFAATAGALAYVAAVGMLTPDGGESSTKHLKLDPSERFQHYTVRNQSVFADVPKRFDQLGIQPVMWAIDRYGVLGAGLGTGSQGVQHVEAAATINRGAAEGGLGKITMELGVPGLLIVPWLVVAFARYVRKLLTAVTRMSRQHARFSYGLVAFLIANVAIFTVATQVFGDVFVLLMIGWTVGFLLAMPELAARDASSRQQRAARRESAMFDMQAIDAAHKSLNTVRPELVEAHSSFDKLRTNELQTSPGRIN